MINQEGKREREREGGGYAVTISISTGGYAMCTQLNDFLSNRSYDWCDEL